MGSRQTIVGAALNSIASANTPILTANFKLIESTPVETAGAKRDRSADFHVPKFAVCDIPLQGSWACGQRIRTDFT